MPSRIYRHCIKARELEVGHRLDWGTTDVQRGKAITAEVLVVTTQPMGPQAVAGALETIVQVRNPDHRVETIHFAAEEPVWIVSNVRFFTRDAQILAQRREIDLGQDGTAHDRRR